MDPTIPKQIQNNLNMAQSNLNQPIQNQNIKEITITKIQEQKQTIPININNPQNINLTNDGNILKETKIITQEFFDPIRFTFNSNSNVNIKPSNIKNRNTDSYKQLIKKIANQLKQKKRPQTQGYFYFALQKGEYPLLIIRKISSQMRNHQIEFNNEVFQMYTQKYKKYKELIKRIAHLLKISMKNKEYFQNLKSKTTNSQFIQNNNVNITANTANNNNILNKNINLNNNIDIQGPTFNSEEIPINSYNNLFNQKKTKTQTNVQTNYHKGSIGYNMKNKYYSNIISDKRINPVNPFFASKERLSFNSNNNLANNNLQNKNQYFLHKEEKTKTTSTNNKPIISQNNLLNKNKKIIDVNLKKQHNNIDQNKMNINMTAYDEIKNDNKMDIIQEGTKTNNVNSMDYNKEKVNVSNNSGINYNNNLETNNIINNISNINTDMNSLNNNNTNNSIFSATPLNSRFAEINDLEMKNKALNLNILSGQDKKTNTINTSLLNTNSNQLNNNINNNNINNNININVERNKNTVSVSNSEERNIVNKNNETNLSMTNNYNSDSVNNITLTSLKKEEDKTYSISIESKKSKGKRTLPIKLSPFKKNKQEILIEEEKSSYSNRKSQNININNIQKLNCNTFTENELDNKNSNDSILYEKGISTDRDETEFLNKFNLFLSKNNISIENFIPMSNTNLGQNYLKIYEFWEKYINYIYLNYSLNNTKLSLFSFIHIIEQYYLWCENINKGNLEQFKKLIIDTITKIYSKLEIKQFCSMNKISNIEELFEKYKIFFKNNASFNSNKNIEIKLNNKIQEECNCDLCKSELACMKKITELNKNKIIGVNIESLFYIAKNDKYQNNEKEDKMEVDRQTKKTYPPKTSSGRKKSSSITKFSESKIKKSSSEKYEYIPKEKSRSKSKSKSKSKRKNNNQNEKKYEEDIKIDTIFKKEEIVIEKKEDAENEDSEKDKKKKNKDKKKEKNKRNKSYKDKKESSSESEEKESKSKKNKKKPKSKKRKKEKQYSDSESEGSVEEDIKVKSNKKKRHYPKD